MANQYVGIAEMKLSTNDEDILVAPNLGSCLALVAYDSSAHVGGVIHCLLPSSASDMSKAKENPCMYVDTGVALLLSELIKAGAKKNALQMVAVGCSAINDKQSMFEIGKKNFTILRKLLWKNSLLLKAEDVGGEHSRTVSLKIATGEVWLKALGEEKRLC